MVTSLHSNFVHKESNLEVAATERWGKKRSITTEAQKLRRSNRFPICKLATGRKELQEIYLENCQSLQEEKRKVDRVSKKVSSVLESVAIGTLFSRL